MPAPISRNSLSCSITRRSMAPARLRARLRPAMPPPTTATSHCSVRVVIHGLPSAPPLGGSTGDTSPERAALRLGRKGYRSPIRDVGERRPTTSPLRRTAPHRYACVTPQTAHGHSGSCAVAIQAHHWLLEREGAVAAE